MTIERIAADPAAFTDAEKIAAIHEACKPGQEMNVSQAIDLICDIFNATKHKYTPPNPNGVEINVPASNSRGVAKP